MGTIRTIQFRDGSGESAVGRVDGDVIRVVEGRSTVYDMALAAIAEGICLQDFVARHLGTRSESYDALIAAGGLLAPVNHPQSDARFLITGTGLTHLGSAETRNSMHDGAADPKQPPKTDSMKLFELGLRGGKPARGRVGAMPEWFYKGDGGIVVPPGQPLSSPNFALACAEEPEITGIYVVAPDGRPWRIGYVLANDLSDHETERQNFMYVAPSKLRDCSMGPELLIGELPDHVEGMSRIRRGGKTLWEGAFASGEAHMSHSIANLEHHHFRHRSFRRPGDLHAHLFGCPVMSFGSGIRARSGDVFEFDVPAFGRPLSNPVIFETGEPTVFEVGVL